MAEIPNINPLHPTWPVKPGEKTGDREKRQKEESRKKRKTDDNKKNSDQSGIDEYA